MNLQLGQLRNVEKFLGDLPFDFLPILIDSESKAANVSRNFHKREKVIPIFTSSSVNGRGLDLLNTFLNLLPVRTVDVKAKEGPVEFKIDQFWGAADEAVLIHGRLRQGVIKREERLRIGPTDDGKFIDCKVLSIKVGFPHIRGKSWCHFIHFISENVAYNSSGMTSSRDQSKLVRRQPLNCVWIHLSKCGKD